MVLLVESLKYTGCGDAFAQLKVTFCHNLCCSEEQPIMWMCDITAIRNPLQLSARLSEQGWILCMILMSAGTDNMTLV